MIKKVLRILWIAFALIIGFYPILYFLFPGKFGELNSKAPELLANAAWNLAFYTHIISGGFALLIGWTQFSAGFRNKRLAIHRQVGKLYVIAVVLSSIAGIAIAFFATGGIIPAAGFICLGIIWFFTTAMAYSTIKKGKILQHQKMMTYSYAACFAAVTLRLWLPLLVMLFKDFIVAYSIVAWLCWIPNLFVAGVLVKRLETVKA